MTLTRPDMLVLELQRVRNAGSYLSDDLGLLGTFYCTLPCLCLLLTLTVQCCYEGTNGCISSLPAMTICTAQRGANPVRTRSI